MRDNDRHGTGWQPHALPHQGDLAPPVASDRQAGALRAFVALADTLVDDYDVLELLQQLVESCVQLVAVDAAGLLLADPAGTLRLVASTSAQTQLLELSQLEAGQGPCVDCFHTGAPVLVPDLAEQATRWPRFAGLAGQAGVASVHAVPMRLRQETIGALNLFHTQVGQLAAADLELAQALADVATIGILHERTLHRAETLTEHLQTALNNRVIIEQSKGMLAQRGRVDMTEAFTRLRRHAREHNLKLSDLARQVATGALDPDIVLRTRARRQRHSPGPG